jgi:hypothetical protein
VKFFGAILVRVEKVRLRLAAGLNKWNLSVAIEPDAWVPRSMPEHAKKTGSKLLKLF